MLILLVARAEEDVLANMLKFVSVNRSRLNTRSQKFVIVLTTARVEVGLDHM